MSTIPKIPPEKMSSEERYDYIFSKKRFKWIDHALMGDIQTFVDGIKHNYFPPRQFLPTDFPRGGGNLALPILVCTSLELISALHTGKIEQKDEGKKEKYSYNDTKNVKEFVEKYFPGFFPQFPLIFWHGVRNGITHKFYPNSFQYKDKTIKFNFVIEDPIGDPNMKSNIESKGNIVTIHLNSFELVRILRESIQKYKIDLQKSDDLQIKFIRIFQSLENFQNFNNAQSSEAEKIVNILTSKNPLYLEDYK